MSIPTRLNPAVVATRPADPNAPASARAGNVSEFAALLRTVRDAGLLRRRVGFYAWVFAALSAALVGLGVAFVLIGDSWFQLIVAGLLGLLLTQFAFLAHEAAHRQVFESGRLNDVVGRILANVFVGISYSWWMHKHSRHHANPNTLGKDPDVERDFVSFTPEDAARSRGLYAWATKRQGYLFFPALTLEGLNLHLHGFRTVLGRGEVKHRWLELSMLLVRVVGYLALVFWALPPGMAFAFVGVQLAVFGVYMGASFAPNHKGMPMLPADTKVDFLRRQVLTSRNIVGGRGVEAFMGGLNYQIEHHLFPSMPRPHLKRAREIAKEYCEQRSIRYTETSLIDSYRLVIAYLNRVGLAAGGGPFECPAARAMGR